METMESPDDAATAAAPTGTAQLVAALIPEIAAQADAAEWAALVAAYPAQRQLLDHLNLLDVAGVEPFTATSLTRSADTPGAAS